MAKIGTFDDNFVGLEIYPKGSSVNVRSGVSTSSTIVVTKKAGELVGLTTGAYILQPDGKWIQTKIGDKYVYVREDVETESKPQAVTKTDAFGMIQKLVESDKKVFETLLRINPLLFTIKQKGIDTTKHEQLSNDLWARLSSRQDEIKKSNMVKWESGIKKGYDKLINWFKSLVSGTNTVGALPAIIIGVVVGAGLAVGGYFIFKPKYDESTVDLKISSELEGLLAKTDPATATKIKNNLENQIDTAYNQGKTDGTFGGISKILLPIGLLVGGYFLFSTFIRTETRKK
jgi:hypothetical protein